MPKTKATAGECAFNIGDRVTLLPFEDQPEQKGTVFEVEKNGMYLVGLDDNYLSGDTDDGIREVDKGQIKHAEN